eukprot:CAMPEP_0196697356 /NCGR_PEP_ID=MMETSP1090-20130531/41676_1 /TAXON_ID=37098 /ORGANISM="Isochrysis sp, Strain CCMP1244" /LENGTH=94 /DNA_ID=CAMNT_0042036967 /DNA_START=173 /DNA_END=454 /DNA_ORIENTATION=+
MDSNNLRCPSGGLWHSTQIRDLSVPECDSGAQREVWEVWLFLAAADRSNVVDGSAFGALSACTFTVGRLAVEGAFLWPTTTAFAGPRTPPSLVA